MSFWITLAVTLAGVNLVRATGRGPVVAIGSVLVLVALALVGGITVDGPGAFAVSAGIGGPIVASWQPLVLRGGRRRMALGLGLLVVGGAAQIMLLGNAAAAPTAAWVWASALFFLAEPSTRILRLVMALIGRPLTVAAESYGLGEAIGVLERWITLAVIAHGDDRGVERVSRGEGNGSPEVTGPRSGVLSPVQGPEETDV